MIACYTTLLNMTALQKPAQMVEYSKLTNANRDLLSTAEMFLKSNQLFMQVVQLKLDSKSTKTSSATSLVSTRRLLHSGTTKEDMPSRSLVGELKLEPTTGSVLTHGQRNGEKTDSSELPMVKSELTATPTVAYLNLPHLSFNDKVIYFTI